MALSRPYGAAGTRPFPGIKYTKQRYSMVPGLGVQRTSNQYRVVPFVMLNLELLNFSTVSFSRAFSRVD
eukprot:1769151-Rhodomonas_salina.2